MNSPHSYEPAAWAMVVSLMSGFLASLGVSWMLVFFAAAGTFFGAGLAPSTGRFRAMIAAPLATIVSAKAGLIIAAYSAPVDGVSKTELAQAASFLCGVIFHPALTIFVKAFRKRAEQKLGVQEDRS